MFLETYQTFSITFKKDCPRIFVTKMKTIMNIFERQRLKKYVGSQQDDEPNMLDFIEALKWVESWQYEQFRKLRFSWKIPQLLDSISSINLTKMKILNLQRCGITNIESLGFLNAPNLIMLTLQENKIVSLKPLSKINFDRLQGISLQFNFFNHHHLKPMQRACFMSKKNGNQKINFIRLSFLDKTVALNQLLAKFPASSLNKIGVDDQDLIGWRQDRKRSLQDICPGTNRILQKLAGQLDLQQALLDLQTEEDEEDWEGSQQSYDDDEEGMENDENEKDEA